jgi:hypothetical protein
MATAVLAKQLGGALRPLLQPFRTCEGEHHHQDFLRLQADHGPLGIAGWAAESAPGIRKDGQVLDVDQVFADALVAFIRCPNKAKG